MDLSRATVLVANRGEIAVRVIRACRELGCRAVAVFSEADAGALHVRLADMALPLGPPPPNQSYLSFDRLLEAAQWAGAHAIHPGYGFLAENAAFAQAVIDRGLIWIGPHPEAIMAMGNKVEARRIMERSGVPVIPGVNETGLANEQLFELAQSKVGFPLLIKAAAGGGGKGMRVVREAGAFLEACAAARREAAGAFGNDTVYLERLLEEARHVEFQIFGDKHGNRMHLYERECSIQRRHQKVVEETPSVAVDDELRRAMGEAAVAAAEAIGYDNAGTVEFLLDQHGRFSFLEMNTRIQVEHPITEMITGQDLVAEQIRVAFGAPLSLPNPAPRQGHAIECRIYAENPGQGFVPSIGPLVRLREPSGPGVRVDSGVYEGWEVERHYDPLLAKLVCHGQDREAARRRMVQALDHYVVLGVVTSIPFLRDVMVSEPFIAGDTTTRFIEKYFPDWLPAQDYPLALALAAATVGGGGKASDPGVMQEGLPDPWRTVGPFEVAL